MLVEPRRTPRTYMVLAFAGGAVFVIMVATGALMFGCLKFLSAVPTTERNLFEADDENWKILSVDDVWEGKWERVVFLYHQPPGSPPLLINVDLVPRVNGPTVKIDGQSQPPENMWKWMPRFTEVYSKHFQQRKNLVIKAAVFYRMPFSFWQKC